MAFADDTLVTTRNLFDLRKAINSLSIEIKKLGVCLNPKKSHIMIKDEPPYGAEEILTQETYYSCVSNKTMIMPDNITYKYAKGKTERNQTIKKAGLVPKDVKAGYTLGDM